MERIMKKPELTEELAARTGYYKKNCKEIVDHLADIITEHFETATYDEPSEFHIAPGVVICGKRVPEQEAVNPKTGETVIACERVRPYAVFKPSIKNKLKRG
jgi:nucleoid DNA-binding protein